MVESLKVEIFDQKIEQYLIYLLLFFKGILAIKGEFDWYSYSLFVIGVVDDLLEEQLNELGEYDFLSQHLMHV